MVSTSLLQKFKDNKAKYARSGGKAYKFAEGRTVVRVLPGKDYKTNEEAPFHHQLAVHWIKADEKAKPIAVVGDVEFTYEDGRISELTPLISQAVAQAKAVGDEEGFKLYKSWFARKSILINGLIRAGADASETEPKLIEMGTSVFSDLMGAIIMYAEEGINALDLKDGIDFVVERSGKGLDTTYTVMAAVKSKPVDSKVMDKIQDLAEHIKREHFRAGEDVKAIAAVTKLTGVTSTTAITAPRATAMLTSSAASVPLEAPKAAPKASPKAAKPTPASEPVEPAPTAPDNFGAAIDKSELDSLLGDLDSLVL